MTLRRWLVLSTFCLLLGFVAPVLASHQTLVIAPGSPGHRQDATLVQALIDEIESRGRHAEVVYLRHQGGRGLPAEQALTLARGLPAPRLVLLHDPAVAFYRRYREALGAAGVVAYGSLDPEHRDWLDTQGIPRLDLRPALNRSLAWVVHREAAPMVLWGADEMPEAWLAPSLAQNAALAGRRLRWESLTQEALPRAERRLASGEVVRQSGFLLAPPTPELRQRVDQLAELGWRFWCLDPAWLAAGCLGGMIVDEAATAAELLDAQAEDGGVVQEVPVAPRIHYTLRQQLGGQDIATFGMSEAWMERQRRGGWLVGVAVAVGAMALLLLLGAGWAEVRRRRRQRLLLLDERTRLPEWPALAARMNRYLHQEYPFQLCWIGFDRLAALERDEQADVASRLVPALAQRLRKLVGSQAYLASLGDGAFAIMLLIADRPQAQLFLERLQRGLNDSIEVGGERHLLLPRLGGVDSEVATSPQALLLAARSAADRVLVAGERHPCWFEPDAVEAASQQAALLEEFRREVRHPAEQFRVTVTPLHRLSNGELAGGSFGLEWRHPRWGVLAPSTWRPLASLSQEVLSLERYLLSVGLRQLGERPAASRLSWSFPLSAQHLESPMFCDWLEARCEEQGLAPNRLELCLDELSLPPGETALRSMHRLRELGVGLSLDGGERGAELLALLRLPLTALRLPGDLTASLPRNQRALLLLKGIREAAVMLGVRVVLTGLDNADQLTSVRGLGYQWGSGPLLGHTGALDEVLGREPLSLAR